ncbi:hypothetical protein PENTCL1PPCAC_30097, partial [Pristionchus entomophagus]
FEVELDDLKRFNPVAALRTVVNTQLRRNPDIFDQCKLVNGPMWTDHLRKHFDPQFDPMKNCNNSYSPWTELRTDGRVWLTERG